VAIQMRMTSSLWVFITALMLSLTVVLSVNIPGGWFFHRYSNMYSIPSSPLFTDLIPSNAGVIQIESVDRMFDPVTQSVLSGAQTASVLSTRSTFDGLAVTNIKDGE
jgi:hypothetical protein